MSAIQLATNLTVQPLGGPTAVIEYGGLRWLTDPSLSPAGVYTGLTKTRGPVLGPENLGQIDVVLLSHDQHSDNLDPAGRAFLPRAARVLTTTAAAARLGGNAVGIDPWETIEVPAPDGAAVSVTALPAQHGPDGSDDLQGPVIGFLLATPGAETVYVSGDNASLEVVREIADRSGAIDVALLFAGAVQRTQEFEAAYLTLSSDHAADAAKILGVRTVVPLHYEGWTHFTQGADQLRAAFAGNGLSDRLALIEPGDKLELYRAPTSSSQPGSELALETEGNRSSVQAAFEGWQAGTATVSDLFAPDMVWRIEGRSLASREYSTRAQLLDEVLNPFAARFVDGEPFRPIRIRSVFADGDSVAVIWDGHGVASDGQAYDNTYAWILRLRNGQVTDGTAFCDSVAFNDLWTRVPVS